MIKPLVGSQGASVTIGVRTAAEAAAAYAKAADISEAVLVEALVPGTDYRVLVIDGQVAAAAQLRPASVTGDGTAHDRPARGGQPTPIRGAVPATRASSP